MRQTLSFLTHCWLFTCAIPGVSTVGAAGDCVARSVEPERKLRNQIDRSASSATLDATLCIVVTDEIFGTEQWSEVRVQWMRPDVGSVHWSSPRSSVAKQYYEKRRRTCPSISTASGTMAAYWNATNYTLVQEDQDTAHRVTATYSRATTTPIQPFLPHAYRALLLMIPYDELQRGFQTHVSVDAAGRLRMVLSPSANNDQPLFRDATLLFDRCTREVDRITIDHGNGKRLSALVISIKRSNTAEGTEIALPPELTQ